MFTGVCSIFSIKTFFLLQLLDMLCQKSTILMLTRFPDYQSSVLRGKLNSGFKTGNQKCYLNNN
ncbi:hypothetical protein BpHYR1_004329 [Brachionus plicatilis]|uniref:Uncharacterized protein n=1 Tax=Brachionus plicatilis TaxID=10195 RepID=A0A3M7SDL8_BRAPC|nr:hypothetical protein BpHYR1_004329 [Brachionus plicatilis]